MAKSVLEKAKGIIPPLLESMHKGQAGKIAVVGGCSEYTGAPYYAAIAALKTGVDISHIFCTEQAGVPIKAYSPELIVHPVFKEKNFAKTGERVDLKPVVKWLDGLHAIVIGPGLGRDPLFWEDVREFLKEVKAHQLPLIIDGDGLNMVCEQPDLVRGYKLAILTPNLVEFKRLVKAVCPDAKEDAVTVKELAQKLGNVTIVQKGKDDVISNGLVDDVICSERGSPRRCGGQGDVLAGTLSAFVSWGFLKGKEGGEKVEGWPILAAFAACSLTRASSLIAFGAHKRATTTPDIIGKIGEAFEAVFQNRHD